MNMYFVREQLRREKREARNKRIREIRAIEHHQALTRFEEAFKGYYGRLPKLHGKYSAKHLNKLADSLFAASHEREIEDEVD